jgi:hypothetical protein
MTNNKPGNLNHRRFHGYAAARAAEWWRPARGALRFWIAIIATLAQIAPAPAVTPGLLAEAQQQQPVAAGARPTYRIEILSAAAKPTRRRQGMVSSESVIRVTDSNDRPVAGVVVTFSVTQLSGGSASFVNGTTSAFVTTNASGIASTGPVTASTASTFNISVSASVSGQTLTATIPVNMATVAAGAGGATAGAAAGAGAGAGAGGGISAAVIGVIAAAGAAAAVVAVKAAGGGDGGTAGGISNGGSTPGNPRIRIGGPGTPTVGAPRP